MRNEELGDRSEKLGVRKYSAIVETVCHRLVKMKNKN